MQRWVGGAWGMAGWSMAVLLLGAEAAPAQQAVRPIEVQCTGSVKQIGRFLQVITDKDETWNFNFSPNIIPGEDIHITGEADPEWLQPGMMVRISAKINTKKGEFLEPISSLEVITLRPENEPGLINENEPKPTDDLFTGGDPKPKKRQKAPKLPEEMTATMIGDIGSLKSGKISIRVPGFKLVKGELAENCKVSVDVANPAMIRVGDKVTIRGDYYAANAPNGGAPGIGSIRKLDVQADAKFEQIKPLKRGQRPYDSAKPGEGDKEEKPSEKAEEKGAPAKKGAGEKKP